jgi:hypothetical protein
MKTVYVVTRGDYSSYRIVGIYDDRALAKKYCAIKEENGYDEPEISGYILNPMENELNSGLKQFWVSMDRDGNTDNVYMITPDPDEGARVYLNNKDGKVSMVCYVWARDEKHAVKIANEKRTVLIATNRWDDAKMKMHRRVMI